MAFVPRTFEQILEDMVAHVQANTVVSDFTVGSVIRTILEAAALEDDEQYFQMVQLLDMFSLSSAREGDLDRRLADFGIVRRQATTATCRIRFFNANLITDRLSREETAGSTSLVLFDTSKFPTTGYPYTIRVGERTTRVQDLTVTNNDTSLGVLTLDAATPTVTDLEVGDRVALVTGAVGYTVNVGTLVQAPPTVSESVKIFITQEPAYVAPGNFFSNEVIAKAQTPGTAGNVGVGRISQFHGSPPFSGAGVTNFSAASGGSNVESDFEFRQRALKQLQSLSRGTPLALETASVGVVDPNTGQTTVSASVVEDFTNSEVVVYVDDGTGLVPDTNTLATDSISTGGGALPLGSLTLPLVDVTSFPSSGYLLIDSDSSSNPAELVFYTSKDTGSNTLTLSSATTSNHDDGSTVRFLDVLTLSAESGRRRFSLQNFPVIRGTDRVFVNEGLEWVELTPGTDYILNRGTGELQITSLAGVGSGAIVVTHYGFYTNLINTVQKTLEGDRGNPIEFPGVKAAGVFLSVEAPTIKRVPITVSISASSGFTESELVESVRQEIEAYVSSLRIGQDVIKSKIVDVVHNVRGIKDVSITYPESNVTVLENELPVPYDSDGTSLVTVL